MNLFKVFDIAGSGMSAQSVRLNTTASNLANSDSVSGSAEEAYRSRQPVFETLLERSISGDTAGGVRISAITENGAPPVSEYAPGHPLANDQGYIFRSNVNIAEEMTNMISASRSFQNNVEVLNTSKEMLLRTINLGR
ncbi:flagellar basal body rod protein FlgC [Wenzhouxiangella sp. AB-CW3]|uniref:flagellar basal body rod protein FlgC n=1 Tax=Wenzhouxiangella sp. AB-CW3 TaxID=2771012 RepID=UPI00168A5C88|nr:flagellar basal body rod protein FlgC [Wenzhouxiangella sp. AB-CW3]QOC21228.1 flagellar basal body rod protein FlgC [Wenzhouxiangella sp. AB-CW3]